MTVSITSLAVAPRSGRSQVFLAAMGVGPMWTLRHAGAATPAAEPATQVAAPAMAAVPAVAVAPAVSTVPAAPAMAAVPAEPAAAAMTDVVADMVVPAVVAPHAPAAAAASAPAPAIAAPDDDSTAWFDDAPAPAPLAPVSDEAIATMDWPALRSAIVQCARLPGDDGATRKAGVLGRGAERADWIVVGGAPSRADEKQGRAISGDAGLLLDNMLRAVGRSTEEQVYVTHLMKRRPLDANGVERAPTAAELAACKAYLDRELVLTGAGTMLVFGQATVRALLGEAAPAGRGVVHRYGNVNLVASFHPDDLLRRGEHKARAWADLCLALGAHAGAD